MIGSVCRDRRLSHSARRIPSGAPAMFILVMAPGFCDRWKGKITQAEGQGLGLDYLKQLKKHIPLFTHIFFFLKSNFFNMGPFPLPSTRLRGTAECELLHRSTGGHALLSLSSRQGWDACNQENNFDLFCLGKISLSL